MNDTVNVIELISSMGFKIINLALLIAGDGLIKFCVLRTFQHEAIYGFSLWKGNTRLE